MVFRLYGINFMGFIIVYIVRYGVKRYVVYDCNIDLFLKRVGVLNRGGVRS